MIFHKTDLHGAGLGTQQQGIFVVEVESVAAVTGRMAFLNVQTGEVIVGIFHFGAVHNGVTHANKNVLDLLQHHVHGMLMAHLDGVAGNGHIDGLGGQLGLQHLGTNSCLGIFQLLFDLCANSIGQCAHDGTLFCGQFAHHLQHSGQLALLTQVLDPELFQSGRGVGRFQGCQSSLFDQL